ncbi:MAG: hypothetical protein LBK47_02090 [Prevotellaceae bacterium]|nr:hypothetical protein [Prevotellaceae bacterium]
MKRLFFFALSLVMLASCHQRAQKAATMSAMLMSGSWVCADVIDAIVDAKSTKALREFPPYTELSFVRDSAKLMAVNGQIEQVQLTYTGVGNKISIRECDGGEDMVLTLENDSVMVFYDELNNKRWQYVKASPLLISEAHGFKEGFVNTLNYRLLSGDYAVIDLETDKRYDVMWKPNGFIYGSPNFTRYMLCFSGDCMNFSTDVSLVQFFSDDNAGEFYGWTVEGGVLSLYSLRTVNQQDEMTEYVADRKLFELRKK